ncbi:hypothetical protein K4K59_003026 [Colletotrichum sp. SAR11_240]|nr:hypothetical protein K4K59_003026 [Colletotrichum sp. SAR11_240]
MPFSRLWSTLLLVIANLLERPSLPLTMMRLSVLLIASTVCSVLADLDNRNTQQPWCHRKKVGQIHIGGQPVPVNYRYIVNAYNVEDDIPKVCHKLWMELRNFWMCQVWSFGLFKQFCREGTEKGTLEWEFETGLACNTGMLEAAWWEATKNKYGRIGCEKK